jgi:hypothetical protein
MGHKRRFLANGLCSGGRVELCLHTPTGGRQTNYARGTNFPPDGVGQIPSLFLRSKETLRDISTEYSETAVNLPPCHKFEKYVVGATEYTNLPESKPNSQGFWYMVKVYVDNFMSIVIPVYWEQLRHVTNAIMHGIHNVFSPEAEDSGDPILEKTLKKGEGMYATRETLLGFDFDGKAKTMWIELAKCDKLLTILKGWLRTGKQGSLGVPFGEFKSTIAKIWHAFTSILVGRGLFLPCNQVLKQCPAYIYLQQNPSVLTALEGCRPLLRKSAHAPTQCQKLVSGWPDYIGIVNASGHGVGRVIVGELSACTPVVLRWEWPDNIKQNIVSLSNWTGTITNSDLKMVGLVML